MKIEFLKVSVKNFLSFGNKETTFEYKNGIHAVMGQVLPGNQRNGVGKSTLLVDSIIMALYNKTLRKLKKNEIINETNKKGCVVSCDFTIGQNYYRVKRTIKPNSLQIWKSSNPIESDDSPIEFDSMNNTQKWLENEIGISYEAFTNIIVMNVNHSKPFLEMEPKEKRPVLSDMLSLGIYGKMSDLAKKEHLNANGSVKELKSILKSQLDTLKLSKDKRKSLLNEYEKFEEDKRQRIKNLQNNIEEEKAKLLKVQSKLCNDNYYEILEGLESKLEKCNSKIKKLLKLKNDEERTIKDSKEAMSYIIDKPHCPTCHTPTDNPAIKEFIQSLKDKIDNATSSLSDIDSKLDKGENAKSKLKNKISSIRQEKEKQNEIKHEVDKIKSSIESLERNVQTEEGRTLDLEDIISKEDIEKIKNEIQKLKKEYDSENDKLKYNKFLRSLLGEEGIGKYVVKMVLPFFNKKVNHYLGILGSDYTISFDTELTETLVSKNMKERSYASFSGGEKKRIDLAVLLGMMDIAKTQNSIDTNILILDEVLDTSMDGEGVESFMEHLQGSFKQSHPDKCIYVITHRKEIGSEYFDTVIDLVKKNGFTEIANIA